MASPPLPRALSLALIALIALLALPRLAAAAPSPRPFTPEELLATRRLDDPQVSPDGKWVAFTVRQKSLAENRDIKDVWALPLAAGSGGQARPITRDGRSEHPRFSPDGRTLLVSSSRSGEPQLWLYELAGGDPLQLTRMWGGADGGLFSADGKLIAFTSEVFPACNGDDACNRKTAADRVESKVKARISDKLFVRHWSDWTEGKRTHLFVLQLSALGTAPRDLTPGDSDWPTWRLGDGDGYDFAPDGSAIAITHKEAAHEAWTTNSDIYLIPLSGVGGAPQNLSAANKGDDALPRFSPDGRQLAWLMQARDGYEADQRKLFVYDLRAGKGRVVSDLEDDVLAITWRRDGKAIVTPRLEKGRFFLESIALDGNGKPARLSPYPAGADFALAPDGTALVVTSGMNRPPELSRMAPGEKPKAITSFNLTQYAGLDLGPAPEELWIEGKDGKKIHSFVLKPAGLAPGVKAPLIVLVHGGPQGAWEDVWGMRWNPALFASRGAVILMPNPRGSVGYGHALTEQITDDWGGLPYDDVLRATDAAEQLPYVEAGRTCAAGASYGGYLVDWIAGHTDRYRCLVTHDGVFDLRSMYVATEELWFPEWEFKGPYWSSKESYEKWSPSSYADQFKTPTLVVQGELDYRVPGEQGLQMFTALQRRGVESRLLWFPDEGHWVLKPRNSQLWYRTVLDWIESHSRASRAGR